MSCTGLESGTLVSFAYILEATCGVTPTLTSSATIASDKTGTVFKFTRASGSWVTGGYVIGMYVLVAGYTATANNTYWKIIGVTATDLTVDDPTNVGVTEVSGAGKTVTIVFGTLRATSPRSLMIDRESLESDEVRASRQVVDIRHGFSAITGSFGFHVSLRSQSELLYAALGGTWTKPAVGSSPNLAMASATPAVGKARITRAAGNFTTEGFRLGDCITTTGFATSANNKQWTILAVGTTTIDLADPTSVAANDASGAGPVITFPGWRMDSRATTLQTLTIERKFGTTNFFDVFKGVAVNEFTWDIAAKSLVQGTAGLLGMTGSAKTGTSIATTGQAPPPTTGAMAALSDVAGIYVGGTRQAYLTSLNITLSNNRTTEGVIGAATTPAIFEGRARAKGTATFFMADATMSNLFYNETVTSMTIRIQDPTSATEFIALTMPYVKFMTDNIDPPQEGPVPITMEFVALGGNLADPSGATIESAITVQTSSM